MIARGDANSGKHGLLQFIPEEGLPGVLREVEELPTGLRDHSLHVGGEMGQSQASTLDGKRSHRNPGVAASRNGGDLLGAKGGGNKALNGSLTNLELGWGGRGEVALEEELGGKTLHGNMTPAESIERMLSPRGNGLCDLGRHVTEGSVAASSRVLTKGHPKQPVGLIMGMQGVTRGGVPQPLRIQQGGDRKAVGMVKKNQFSLLNGLLGEASRSSKGIGILQGKTIHLRVSDQRLGIIRKGEGCRRNLIPRQLYRAESPNSLEAVKVGQERLHSDNPFRAAQRTTLGEP
jgi:hypothetical protein